MSAWITVHPFFSPLQLDEKPAVYAVYDGDNGLIYVGETTNLRSRFQQHNFVLSHYSLNYRGNQFDAVDILIKAKYSKKFGQEAMVERRLIKRLRPLRNQRGVANA